MNLATAKKIIANWDKPLIRQLFWYLVIPAHVEVQRAEPLTYAYRNAWRVPYRYIYLMKFFAALGVFALASDLDSASNMVLLLKLGAGYFIAMYAVWVLAYFSMKMPAQT